jgi:hypothetical protein
VTQAELWEELSRYTWNANVGISVSIVADLLIAGTMTYILKSHQSGFNETQTAMNRLIAYSLGTGALTRYIYQSHC